MDRFRRLGVFLDESPADAEALAFTGRFAALADSESVLCIHVRDRRGEASGPDPEVSAFEARVLAQLPEAVAKRTKVEVHSGSGIAEILRSARDLELDLIIVGRRLPAEQMGVGSTFTRLARKAPCSVLIVPNHVRTHLSRLLVPVDFSEHSHLAAETALAIARSSGAAHPQVIVQTIYSIGYGFKKTAVSLTEAVARRESVAHQKIAEFVAKLDTSGVEFESICTCSERTADAVHELAAVLKMDAIVVGSRGLSTPAVVLLGATAEKILLSSPLPVLVVKRKGETTHLLDALLERI
ncbi:MAG: universal stress protein [Planctomycetes bacterium]|nr:universal stress protein [Planctomycetota bacterium]